MSRTVVLFSGGIDSAVCLKLAKDPMALAVHYGQRHRVELDYAEAYARHYGIPFTLIHIPPMPMYSDNMTYAGRNAALLTAALQVALTLDAAHIMIGCNADDAARFPDCRTSFLKAMSEAFHVAYGVKVSAPLAAWSKRTVMEYAVEHGIDLAETWSCYDPTGGQPCGKCLACTMRQ